MKLTDDSPTLAGLEATPRNVRPSSALGCPPLTTLILPRFLVGLRCTLGNTIAPHRWTHG